MFYIVFNSLTKKYFQFSGRTNRKEYIIFTAFFFLLCKFLELFVFSDLVNSDIHSMNFYEIESYIYIALFFILFLFIPSLSITIRRLHDLNLSGWWVLFIYLLTMLCIIFFKQYVFLFGYIIDTPLLILKGTSGTNKYGEEHVY